MDEERQKLYTEFDSFILDQVPTFFNSNPIMPWFIYSPGRKLLDLRTSNLALEIESAKVPEGKIKVWYIYNMGVVAKTSKHTIAFDLSAPYFSSSLGKIGDLADIILTSHEHADHYSVGVLSKAKKLVFPAGTYLAKVFDQEKTLELESGKETEIDGIKVTAFQTDHRGNKDYSLPVAWYLVEMDGFKLLHTGDGRDFKNPQERAFLESQSIDIMFVNTLVDPFNIRDIKPKIAIPLHLHEIMHNREFLEKNRFDALLSSYSKKADSLRGIKTYLLFWGENIEYSK